jgi:hypothetical protein
LVKDPKQIVDSFRTDVRSRNIYSDLLRQFDLERPNRGRNRRKLRLLKNQSVRNSAAILSLCLVTGLSAGTGSAFADDEIAPNTAPLDQPASKAKVDVKQPTKHERKVERPLREAAPQELQVKKPDQKSMVEENKAGEKSSNDEMAPIDLVPKEEPTQKASADRSKASKKEQSSSKSQASGVKNRSSQEMKSTQSTVKEQPKQRTKTTAGVGSATVKPETFSEAPKDQSSHQTEELLVASSGSNQATTQTTSQSNQPQTVNGGKLPDTAGNDLNGVLTGVGMALLGSLYALRRGRAKKS